MKGVRLLPFLAAGIIAAPAPASSTNSTVPVLTKNCGEYNFELYLKEYCNIEFASIKPEVHAHAKFNHSSGYEYDQAVEQSSPIAFILDDVSLSIRHNPNTSETTFDSGDCKWKDGDMMKESCGWCDQGVPWTGSGATEQIDCSTSPELSGVNIDSMTLD